MKIAICSIGMFVAVLVMSYLVGSFVAWEINPGAWPHETRVMIACLGMMFAPVFAFAAGAATAMGVKP